MGICFIAIVGGARLFEQHFSLTTDFCLLLIQIKVEPKL